MSTAVSVLPRTRKAAMAAGLDKYQTGKPCRAGHIAARYANSGACSKCVAESNADPARGAPSAERSTTDQISEQDWTFIRTMLVSGSRVHAARVAYPTCTDAASRAAHALARKAIRDEIDRQREAIRNEINYDLQKAFLETEHGVAFVVETKNSTALARMYELRFRLAGLLVDRAKIEVMHQIDLTGARERALRTLHAGDVIDVTPIESTQQAALPAVRPARPMPNDFDPFA